MAFREGSKAAEIAALLQKGVAPADIMQRLGAASGQVYTIRRKLKADDEPEKKTRKKYKKRQKRQPHDTRIVPLMLECIISRGGEKLAHVMTGETDFAEVLAVALLRAKGTP